MLLANGLYIFPIKGNTRFSNGPKALRSLETCELVNNNWKVILIIRITYNICWNFQSYFSTTFYFRFQFIRMRIRQLYDYIESFYIDIISKQNIYLNILLSS